jgi:hypothetical protein
MSGTLALWLALFGGAAARPLMGTIQLNWCPRIH